MNAEFVPRDTKAVLHPLPVKECSRSLYFDRYSRPDLAKDERQQFFTDGFVAHTSGLRCGNWGVILRGMSADTLHAQLQSRLMVNMAGGVMENAGLCLDRFGLPYLPGSAVKGCARRAALAALHEWCGTGEKPTGADNFFTGACEPFATAAAMLGAIARIFGWSELDWSDQRGKDGRLVSDFAWACSRAGDSPAPSGRAMTARGNVPSPDSRNNSSPEGVAQPCPPLRDTVARQLARELRRAIPDGEPAPWKHLPHFAGSVSFLPAYPVDLGQTGIVEGLPVEVPPLGKLELDVVTCHHPDYYGQKRDRNGNLLKPVATDDEDPNPVVFPAVAPGHVFAFALLKLRGTEADENNARTWLGCGLQTFGLGAKTAAGYGWFDSSEAVHTAVTELLRQRAEREKKAAEEKAAKEKAEAEAKARAAERAEREAALAGLSADERADKEVELMTPAQFDNKIRSFNKEPKKGGPADEQKKAIVRALRGPRQGYWQEFKLKATKGDLASAANAIREVSKQMFPGKEGKMP